jgi:hypothetical protein
VGTVQALPSSFLVFVAKNGIKKGRKKVGDFEE